MPHSEMEHCRFAMENIFCVPAQAIPNRPCVNHGVRIAAPPPLLALPGRTPARLATRCHLATALARQATVAGKRRHPLRRPAWRPSSTRPKKKPSITLVKEGFVGKHPDQINALDSFRFVFFALLQGDLAVGEDWSLCF
jgi:hypothetical protein